MRRCRVIGVLSVLALLSFTGLAPAPARAQEPESDPWLELGDDEEEDEEEDDEEEDEDDEDDERQWRWKQVLAHPRIGGRLTTIAVDPRNPRRIFVGTEESTILRTTDGGVTWREFELGPFVPQDRRVRVDPPGLPRLGKQTRLGFTFFLDAPFRVRPSNRVTLRFETLFFDIKPDFLSLGFKPKTTRAPTSFLFAVARSRRGRTNPVKRIAICPGAPFPLLVATKRAVLGSPDDGLTWVRLFRVPKRNIRKVKCASYDSNQVAVASDFGLFLSSDGGLSFEQELSGRPGRRATAVEFDRPTEDGRTRMFVAFGSRLYHGVPSSDRGLRMVYPDFNNSATAPWRTIRQIQRTDDDTIWLATSDGIRVSRDGGESWEMGARSLVERHRIKQVKHGPDEGGGQRIAVLYRDCPLRSGRRPSAPCRSSGMYATDDGGESWFPFFVGLSRRTVRKAVVAPAVGDAPPRWWLVTSGELWATVSRRDARWAEGPVLREAADKARTKLRYTLPLQQTIESVLEGADLSPEAERELVEDAHARAWAPQVDLQMNADFRPFSRLQRRVGAAPFRSVLREDRHEWRVFATATWSLRSAEFRKEELGRTRRALNELRRQLAFIAEDSWHERRLHLERIAGGMRDPLQVAILEMRVEALETVLQHWMDRPLDTRRRAQRE